MLFGGEELDPKAGAFAFFGLDANPAAHAIDDFPDEREADPGADVASVSAGEHIEYPGEHGLGNADAMVFDPDAGPMILVNFTPDRGGQ